jgi:hypothetical protein
MAIVWTVLLCAASCIALVLLVLICSFGVTHGIHVAKELQRDLSRKKSCERLAGGLGEAKQKIRSKVQCIAEVLAIEPSAYMG